MAGNPKRRANSASSTQLPQLEPHLQPLASTGLQGPLPPLQSSSSGAILPSLSHQPIQQSPSILPTSSSPTPVQNSDTNPSNLQPSNSKRRLGSIGAVSTPPASNASASVLPSLPDTRARAASAPEPVVANDSAAARRAARRQRRLTESGSGPPTQTTTSNPTTSSNQIESNGSSTATGPASALSDGSALGSARRGKRRLTHDRVAELGGGASTPDSMASWSPGATPAGTTPSATPGGGARPSTAPAAAGRRAQPIGSVMSGDDATIQEEDIVGEDVHTVPTQLSAPSKVLQSSQLGTSLYVESATNGRFARETLVVESSDGVLRKRKPGEVAGVDDLMDQALEEEATKIGDLDPAYIHEVHLASVNVGLHTGFTVMQGVLGGAAAMFLYLSTSTWSSSDPSTFLSLFAPMASTMSGGLFILLTFCVLLAGSASLPENARILSSTPKARVLYSLTCLVDGIALILSLMATETDQWIALQTADDEAWYNGSLSDETKSILSSWYPLHVARLGFVFVGWILVALSGHKSLSLNLWEHAVVRSSNQEGLGNITSTSFVR